ncbi:M15 family metallopeptidase [Flavobacterium sp.]|uniref:M15 family metallopeptidase n=1 Tax=Flavobacterium sp. TaxID=239 RepID=UPI003D0BDF61
MRFLNFSLFLFSVACFAQIEEKKTIISDTTFVNIQELSKEFVYDMKYATDQNFLKTKVYDCPSCLLRYKTALHLIEANKEFQKKGYRIKLFDCYRPLSVQKKMWDIVPDANYVANPTRGSIHNRGGAVDITLVNADGEELNMGTDFDHFGPEASHLFLELPKKILKNRKYLKGIMQKHHFESYDSEWWHYNLVGSKKTDLSNFNWQCN